MNENGERVRQGKIYRGGERETGSDKESDKRCKRKTNRKVEEEGKRK